MNDLIYFPKEIVMIFTISFLQEERRGEKKRGIE